jgi:hypothetical protein
MTTTRSLVIEYAKGCQNSDGGYAFCQGVDSNAQDTFFALSILDMLKASPKSVEKTIRWLEAFPRDDIHSKYYIISSLVLLNGKNSMPDLGAFPITSRFNIDRMEYSFSEFESLFMLSCLAKMLGKELDEKAVAIFLLKHHNGDGGFGQNKHSNLLATLHAISILRNVGYNIQNVRRALEFVRACESPDGGFTSVPNTHLPFIEDTYSGISILELYGESVRQPQGCIQQIMKLLRSNGGFSRAEFGIPTLEYTYYAIYALVKLGYFRTVSA